MACICFGVARADDASAARDLLLASHETSTLAKVMPYEFRATVTINPGDPNQKKGQIVIYRDKDRSRSELQVEDYREVKLTLGNKLYVVRSTPFPVPQLGQLHDIDHGWDRYKDDADAKLGDVSKKKVQNTDAECFEVKSERKHRLCFEPAHKVLVESLDQRMAYEFSDYASLEQQWYPRKITGLLQMSTRERPIMVVEGIQVRKVRFADGVFAPPEHALEFDTCEELKPPRPVKTATPEISNRVLRQHADSPFVNVYGVVDKDGNLENPKVLTTDPDVREPVLQALKKWHFSPARCGTTAVSHEAEFPMGPVDFGSMGAAQTPRK